MPDAVYNAVIDGIMEDLVQVAAGAQRAASTVSTRTHRKLPVWWSGETAQRRNNCTRVRRELTRLRSRNRDSTAAITQLEAEFKASHKELKKLINAAKKARWRELFDRLDEDIWGDGYSVVMKHMCGYLPCRLATEEVRRIVGQLFPSGRGCHNIRGQPRPSLASL